MATADGMTGASTLQSQNKNGTGLLVQDFTGKVMSEALKQISTPQLWAGAIAGFFAGLLVGKSWDFIIKKMGK